MKKLINDPLEVVEDTIVGILKAYPRHFRRPKGSKRVLVQGVSDQRQSWDCNGRWVRSYPGFLRIRRSRLG